MTLKIENRSGTHNESQWIPQLLGLFCFVLVFQMISPLESHGQSSTEAELQQELQTILGVSESMGPDNYYLEECGAAKWNAEYSAKNLCLAQGSSGTFSMAIFGTCLDRFWGGGKKIKFKFRCR